jgi:uncharacterized protein (DUF4415 family)
MPKNKQNLGSNFKALDAHVISPKEYEEAPEWTNEEIAAADLREGGKLIRRGRGRPPLPPGERKTEVKFRLDSDLAGALRASGPGWQTRANAALREAMFGHQRATGRTEHPRSRMAAARKGKTGGAGRGHRREVK